MNTIILQKKYLVLIETAQDMWTLFLVIVNFIFTIKERIDNISDVIYSYFENTYFRHKLIAIKVSDNQNISFKNKDQRAIYSNLLSPPFL